MTATEFERRLRRQALSVALACATLIRLDEQDHAIHMARGLVRGEAGGA